MMEWYLVIKTIHIISSTILFGTGIGIAFFMWWSNLSDNISVKLFAAKSTVIADFLFTTPAVVIQPVSGFILLHMLGYNFLETWLVITYILYIIAGLCWLPVVWIQIQLYKIINNSMRNNLPIPDKYYKLFYIWFSLGWPAFISLVIIFFLMVFKPAL
ncbi:Uncharacterized protein NF27_HS00450 [Candidatus Jidaibacter acanthamoeba]|uniref:Integral membrane protein n=2 Tax=Candidatus Jidaibacter acanthamoebae TaxID=86105 RepID=A0A0C1QJX4_9RICK|nr:Uncharacterized protein NF27_HS00450 [Candidatus Jidaibacter acanthamoeba]